PARIPSGGRRASGRCSARADHAVTAGDGRPRSERAPPWADGTSRMSRSLAAAAAAELPNADLSVTVAIRRLETCGGGVEKLFERHLPVAVPVQRLKARFPVFLPSAGPRAGPHMSGREFLDAERIVLIDVESRENHLVPQGGLLGGDGAVAVLIDGHRV